MPETPRRGRHTVVPAFGAHLRALRGPQSRGVVCRRLEELVGVRFDRSTLLRYEAGEVLTPDPLVLWGLARIYLVPLEDLLVRLHADRLHRPAPILELDPRRRQLLNMIETMTSEVVDSVITLLLSPHLGRRRRAPAADDPPASPKDESPSSQVPSVDKLRRAQ
jgi:hypothetical protein